MYMDGAIARSVCGSNAAARAARSHPGLRVALMSGLGVRNPLMSGRGVRNPPTHLPSRRWMDAWMGGVRVGPRYALPSPVRAQRCLMRTSRTPWNVGRTTVAQIRAWWCVREVEIARCPLRKS